MIEEKSKVSPAQITEWKKKHGDVFQYKVDGKAGYLKRPDRRILAYATSLAEGNPLKFNEALLENCWLGGDEEIKTKDSYFMGISAKLDALIQIEHGELEKL